MSIVDDLKSLDTNAIVIISVFFVSFIAPAFLLIYKLNKPIFIQLDTIKLIILSISIASPSFQFPVSVYCNLGFGCSLSAF